MEQLTRRLVYDTLKAECTEKWGSNLGQAQILGAMPLMAPTRKNATNADDCEYW